MDFPAPDPADEPRHPTGSDDRYWGESWYFDFAAADGSLGGYVRLGLYPNMDVGWYWACLVGPDRPLVTVIDQEVALPRSQRSLEIRSEGLWADHNQEQPLTRWSLGLEAFALSLDDPLEVYGDFRGDRVPFGFELEWETNARPFRWMATDRYEIPCRVHGNVLVGDETIELDVAGQRDHSWGIRDWWHLSWVWLAFHFEDGTRIHGTDVDLGGAHFSTGYVQDAEWAMVISDLEVHYERTAGGLARSVRGEIAGIAFTVTPLAWSPVLLTSPDGEVSHFARCLASIDAADGRHGTGWIEFNLI